MTVLLAKIGAGLIFLLPPALVIYLIWRNRQKREATALYPFDDVVRRPAGESLRLKIAELEEDIDPWLFTALFTPVLCAAIWAITGTNPPNFAGLFIVNLVTSLIARRKLQPLLADRARYLLGFQGERFVAEELNQLMSQGYIVFHDVPFPTYNVDHVVIGPTGVFVIETKTRRKPVVGGIKHYEVVFDGEALLFPHGRDTGGLDQAKLNARSFSKWLASASADRTTAIPILTIPGWLVTRKGRGDVIVVNPKEIRGVVSQQHGPRLTAEMIQRAHHQLEQKCRLSVD